MKDVNAGGPLAYFDLVQGGDDASRDRLGPYCERQSARKSQNGVFAVKERRKQPSREISAISAEFVITEFPLCVNSLLASIITELSR
jgi:hypothetical protein